MFKKLGYHAISWQFSTPGRFDGHGFNRQFDSAPFLVSPYSFDFIDLLKSGSDSVPGTDSVPESDSVPHIRFRTQIRFRTRAKGKIFGYGIGSGTESVWQFRVRNRINYGYGIGNWMMKNHSIPSFKLFTRTSLVRLLENFYVKWWLQIRQWLSYSI